MEFQARITDNRSALDLPIEAKTSAMALILAHKAKFFIQDKHLLPSNLLSIASVAEVIRHSDNFIEHQMVWSSNTGFIQKKEIHSWDRIKVRDAATVLVTN